MRLYIPIKDEVTMCSRLEGPRQNTNPFLFPYYGLSYDEWFKVHMRDNTRVNVKTASIADKSHIRCKNHKLNLKVNKMVDGDNILKDIV
jgi:hypothetical protein